MISPNFSRDEFACTDGCGFDTVDSELLTILESIRQHFDAPVTVASGCRCPRKNDEVSGSAGSKHLQGRAADIKVAGVDPVDVQDFFDRTWPDSFGMGRYEGWTHVDSRSKKARW